MQHMPWDHALTVTDGGSGLVGHAGAILLRKAADQAGLTAWLSAALQKAGQSPVFGRDGGLAGADRPGPGEGPGARVGTDREHGRGVPVAGHRREDPDRLAGDRPGRHLDYRALG